MNKEEFFTSIPRRVVFVRQSKTCFKLMTSWQCFAAMLLATPTDAFLIGIFADGHKLNLYSPLPFHTIPWDPSNGSF